MKNKQPERKLRPGIGLTRHLIGGVFCLTVISLICARASAQNLFATNVDTIDEFTPNGVRSTFASGLNIPFDLAFDKSGNLFVAVADAGSGAVVKFTPAGVRATVASGLTFTGAILARLCPTPPPLSRNGANQSNLACDRQLQQSSDTDARSNLERRRLLWKLAIEYGIAVTGHDPSAPEARVRYERVGRTDPGLPAAANFFGRLRH